MIVIDGVPRYTTVEIEALAQVLCPKCGGTVDLRWRAAYADEPRWVQPGQPCLHCGHLIT
jgi:hypothetical protein